MKGSKKHRNSFCKEFVKQAFHIIFFPRTEDKNNAKCVTLTNPVIKSTTVWRLYLLWNHNIRFVKQIWLIVLLL